MSKFARKGKPPPGYDYLEPVLEALENELRDKVNEPHEGKRKVESLWPVHQINWQRTRYVYDMHYKYKNCLLYTSPSPRDGLLSRMPSSA